MIVHFMEHGMTACQKPGPPAKWEEGHRWSSVWEDVTCLDCLRGREPIETFTVSADGKSITCKRCKRTSYNPNDVLQAMIRRLDRAGCLRLIKELAAKEVQLEAAHDALRQIAESDLGCRCVRIAENALAAANARWLPEIYRVKPE
jgi:hypothetical protein